MAIEKRWTKQGPVFFTEDGSASGLLKVSSVECFKVKQKVVIGSDTQPLLALEIKRIPSLTEIIVGPGKDDKNRKITNLNARTDISAYTLADNAFIRAEEQSKVTIPEKDILQAVYEFEPTVAIRTIGVDKVGSPWGKENPLPVQVSGITITGAHLNVQLSRLDTASSTHDSTRIGNQTLEWDFRPTCDSGKGEGRVADTLHCGGTSALIIIDDTPVAISVTPGTPKGDRKTVYIRPREKGVYWGFHSNITPDDVVPTGGDPIGRLTPCEFVVEANTPIYLVGPPSGVKIFVAEA